MSGAAKKQKYYKNFNACVAEQCGRGKALYCSLLYAIQGLMPEGILEISIPTVAKHPDLTSLN